MGEYIKTFCRIWMVLLLFIMLTGAFYFGFNWLDHYQENFHRYDEPDGGAVKVFRVEQTESPGSEVGGAISLWPRLTEFLRNGE